ncbi:hypothetical protein FISHEDRAFT_69714 [Fistulina hepatica ATCC 64428]|uniref:Uncharacterized protein n=1 Tax=Fistulina hepatica ATCC 64428 TaxID=1128425 RepID=A0A0D7AL33_9AGAR|nr:hypothetical protein FISHEDRAFT_69714 [Fistulina hepatica ATCC 64428]
MPSRPSETKCKYVHSVKSNTSSILQARHTKAAYNGYIAQGRKFLANLMAS